MYVCCQIYWPHDDAKERVYDVVRVTRVGRSKGPVHTTVLDVSFIKDNVSNASSAAVSLYAQRDFVVEHKV